MEMIPFIHESHGVINLRNLSNLVVMKEAALKHPPTSPMSKTFLTAIGQGTETFLSWPRWTWPPLTSEFDMKKGGGMTNHPLGLIHPSWLKKLNLSWNLVQFFFSRQGLESRLDKLQGFELMRIKNVWLYNKKMLTRCSSDAWNRLRRASAWP